jgi:DNA-binding XRE family transcriptional regulator
MESEGRRFTWLAREAGKSRQTIYNVANGLHPTLTTAEAIAKALGREVEDVFPDIEELAA